MDWVLTLQHEANKGYVESNNPGQISIANTSDGLVVLDIDQEWCAYLVPQEARSIAKALTLFADVIEGKFRDEC